MSRKLKIKLLDLCCGAGGAAMGYYRAAEKLGLMIEITGIDIKPQPNYPFKFLQADAVDYVQKYWKKYTHFHASPPCQEWTPGGAPHRQNGAKYPIIIEPIRQVLEMTGRRGVIENVPQAPIRKDVLLRGDMFGLKVIRKRHFELVNWFMLQHHLPRLKGSVKGGEFVCIYGNASWKAVGQPGAKTTTVPEWRLDTIKNTWAYAMGIDWHMKDVEISEAIPPAYTEYIGINFLNHK